MENTISRQLRQRYEAETALLRLERRRTAAAQQLKQAKWDKRNCNVQQLAYEGSLRAILDKISGKQADKTEALHRSLRHAEEKLNALLREQAELEQQRFQLSEALAVLPSMEFLREQAEKEPEAKKEWAALEARFCAEALTPLLEENHRALLEMRNQMRGGLIGIMSLQELEELRSQPNVWGEQCRPLVERLKTALDELEIPFDIGGYYHSPTSYIVSAASEFNRMDRINNALDQVEAVQKQVSHITGLSQA